jgi:hypothetical protein
MLVAAAIVLLAWLIGVTVLDVGKLIHVLLLVGLMLLLLGFLRARDAAASATRASARTDQK